MTDDVLERDLAAALRARDPGPPSDELVDRVAAIPSAEPAPGWRTGFARLAPAAGVLAAVVVVALVLTLASRGTFGPGPGSSVAPPTPASFDPTAEGPGLVALPYGSEIIVVITLVIVLASVALLVVRRRAFQWLIAGVATAVIGGTIWLNSFDAIGWRDGSFAPGIGYDPNVAVAEGVAAFPVEPDGVLTFGFDVTNQAAVPVRIVGIAPSTDFRAWGRVTSAGLLRDEHDIDVDPSHVVAFQPVTIEPGERRFLVVAGRADKCANGDPDSGDTAGAVVGPIDVVYEILGFRRAAAIVPHQMYIPMDGPCMTGDVRSPDP
jgi:hypothetical protein